MSDDFARFRRNDCRSHFSSARHTNVECGLHIHFHMEIVIVTSGSLNMTIGAKEYTIQAHRGIFIPPLISHAFSSKTPNTCHVLMFSEELAPSFFDYFQKNAISVTPFEVSKESYALTERILPDQLNHPDQLTAKAAIYPLCLEIAKQCESAAKTHHVSNFFKDALYYIGLHYSEELTLKTVAQAIGIHPVTLSKGFSKYSTISFSNYLNFLRCTRAAEIIRLNRSSITEAAYSVGFNTIRSFNRAFKETFGVTPSTYKKSPSSYYHH